MTAEEDKKLYIKIGVMSEGIKHVGEKVDKIIEKVDCVDQKMVKLNETAVKQDQCAKRTQVINTCSRRCYRRRTRVGCDKGR
jgi:hypothetical protein